MNIVVTDRTTVEDILNFKKSTVQSYLRSKKLKINGTKLELAQRVVDTIHHGNDVSIVANLKKSVSDVSPDPAVPDISELKSGWTSDANIFPKLKLKDVENYLLNSSHRTEDSQKMQCYRQYIRGLNFFKEGYIHKMMVNEISQESRLCYVRSKCYPSMKSGVYEQWVLITKEEPFQILKANCSCPAGLGEGYTHIFGLLFSLEGRPILEEHDDIPCTSKPCQWNRPSKRKKETKPIDEISFKRVKYEDTLKVKKVKNKINVKVNSEKFRNALCAKLQNKCTYTPSIFYIISTQSSSDQIQIPIEADLNVTNFEEVETSEHIVYDSDKYLNVVNVVNSAESLTELSTCSEEIVNEIDIRTKGQNNNPLWRSARTGRVAASIFHDIKTKKDSTKSDNLVTKILNSGDSANDDIRSKALVWGRKREDIAKKRYIACKKLKENKKITITEKGFILHPHFAYIGASPDGVVTNQSGTHLIEIKCPYKWRHAKLMDACKDKNFCCYTDNNNNIQLKKNHRYYTQIQGQMGVCNINKCDFVIYTINDFVI